MKTVDELRVLADEKAIEELAQAAKGYSEECKRIDELPEVDSTSVASFTEKAVALSRSIDNNIQLHLDLRTKIEWQDQCIDLAILRRANYKKQLEDLDKETIEVIKSYPDLKLQFKGRLAVHKSPMRLVIDEDKLETAYFKAGKLIPNKENIRRCLELGVPIEGARFEQGEHLKIFEKEDV